MVRPLFFILLTVFTGIMISCTKTCFCTTAIPRLHYVGFPAGSTDSLRIMRFAKGNSFRSPLDTFIVSTSNSDLAVNGDTLWVQPHEENRRLISIYDYIIELPSLRRRDSISNIFELYDQVKGSSTLECNCTNRIPSYSLNDSTIQTVPEAPVIRIRY